MWFSNSKIGVRIAISFAVVIFLATILGVASMHHLHNAVIKTDEIHDHPFAVSNSVRDIRANIFAIHRSMKDIVLAQNQRQITEAQDTIALYVEQAQADFDIVYKQFLGEKKDVDEVYELFHKWAKLRQHVIDLMSEGKTAEAAAYTNTECGELVDSLLIKTQAMINFANYKAESFIAEAKKDQMLANSVVKRLLILIVVVSVFIGIVTTRSISVPLRDFIEVLQRRAIGDLDYRINSERTDEVGELSNAFDQMCDDLQKSIVSIQKLDAANQQLTATEMQLRAANQQLAAEEQQIRAANQQLVANEMQLRAANQQLTATEMQLRAANQQLMATELQLRAANRQLVAEEQQLRAANQQLTATEMQLRAANQQLMATELQLRAANRQLVAEEQQLRAANQQLAADEKQLTVMNQQLQVEIAERKKAEKVIEKRILALTQPLEGDLVVSFEELFDIDQIQRLQDEFALATGVASVITSTDGTPITRPCNFTEFCNIIRSTEKGCENCYRSDAAIGAGADSGPVIRQCMSGGLWDAGAAISVGGKHIANWLIGQVRYPGQTEQAVLDYSNLTGAGRQALLDAFRKVPVMAPEKFEQIAKALYSFADQLSSIAYQNVQQARFIADQKKIQKMLSDAKHDAEEANTELEMQTKFAQKMAQKADAANVAKSQFLANMSHEIRTPMNAIIGLSELLAGEDISNDQRDTINVIVDCGHHLLKLINDILDFSKVEAGELTVDKVDFPLDKLLNTIDSLMRPKTCEKGLEFKIIKGYGLPTGIHTDPERLNQCLVNLVDNAIKFTHSGHVHLNVDMVENGKESLIRFNIQDTGIGIPYDKQDLIFESFKQADGSTTRKYGGTGLGLTITKQLAGLLGGRITLASQEGIGSVFSLMIPTGVCAAVQVADVSRGMGATGEDAGDAKSVFNGRALIVEDNQTNQIVIRRLLERSGVEVTVVADGRSAVETVLASDYDIIFMDIQMPVMNGYEATKLLRQEGVKTPIVALTANAMAGDDEKCYNVGCNDYISKPVHQKDVHHVLSKYLSA